MNIFNLFGKITLDTLDYTKGIDTAKAKNTELETSTSNMSAKSVISWAAIATAIVKVVQVMKQLIVDTLNYADTFDDMSAKYDTSVKSLQEFNYMASQTGTSLEAITSSMAMMYNRAKEGDDAFDKIGVSVRDANGNLKKMDELFWEVKEKLDSVENSGEKSAAMLDVFGRSAMTNGEFFRKNASELQAMADEANRLGFIMDESLTNSAGAVNDKLAQIRLQGQSLIASLLGGEEDADQKINAFLDNIEETIEAWSPKIIAFAVKLFFMVIRALVQVTPSLASNLISAFIDTIFSTNWFQVGVDIGLAILEGIVNALGDVLKIFGVDVPDANFRGDRDYISTDIGLNDYEITERSTSKIDISLSVSGDGTAISEDNAKVVGDELANKLDALLGGKI